MKRLDTEGLEDVGCGDALEKVLESRGDPVLLRALRRIRALEGGLHYADDIIKAKDAEMRRIRDLVFPDSLPLDDALYLAIKEMME